ncbi:MAG: hypothetical protein QF890_12965 [Myxococcota bacterium]|nr:hypothetical protein [Deltaproteobacteria bacterium]MCP4239385.1 hypothetical protein [bacterium]MDP6075646.1 hypothetical protein [Myxococcota bacterium]MDP6244205.1 hypothetical protein [Myxococcota bacterium]MDP7075390.1 hypothetical protein [Myxococcota bacterium]
MKLVAARLLLAAVAVGMVLAAAEGFLRWRSSDFEAFGAAQELPWIRTSPDRERTFTVDPRFGFRPRLDGEIYDEYGTQRNEYGLEKPAGRTRVLFMGDSVTARRTLVDAISDIYGDERFEYWNAGVESFNTVQEVAFYLEYNAAIAPDHVVLTFHLNDYETTPIAFLDDEGRVVVFALNQPARRIQPWLFEHSWLYRFWLGRVRMRAGDFAAVAQEVHESLRQLRDVLREEGIRLTVLVLPLMQRPGKWRPQERNARLRVLKFLNREGIRHFDLLPPLRKALERGVPFQESRGDVFHPSPEVSKVFAEYLAERALLRDNASER